MNATWNLSLATGLALALAACSDTGQVTEPRANLEPAFSQRAEEAEDEDGRAGAVYAATNGAQANEVLVFPRASDGSLSGPQAFATGGRGTGGGLGNQDGVVLSRSNRRLFVVNAGSNDLSMFAVRSNRLELLDRVRSGGARPVSVAVRRGLVYVLNAGGSGNVAGFVVAGNKLLPLVNSTRPLSSTSAGAAQVSFNPEGRLLVVTEKATNKISTYTIGHDGLAAGPTVQLSVGATPFGFAFSRRGTLVVSEAFGGAPDASALSSYRVGAGGVLSVVSPSVGTTESAACWVVITMNGRFVYTSNTGSGTITGYALDRDGSLLILDSDGVTATTGAGPIDLALTNNSRFLYSLDSGSGTISAFRVEADGRLTALSGVSGLAAGANGLAAS
ncbi:MAG: lactonase family protein [Gemmatimonadales bacterium]